jgi:hypothetical protein
MSVRTYSSIDNYDDNNRNKRCRLANINIFDDKNFIDVVYRENNNIINDDELFNVITDDIIKCYRGEENLKLGYIIYSKMLLNSQKMNFILNNFIQNKNSNIHLTSVWEIIESNNNIDKIKIKIIVGINNKDLAIKKLTYEILKLKSNHNIKYNNYLKKFIK